MTLRWFDNDAFWQTFYSTMFGADSFAQARKECPQLLALAGIDTPKILDLACGPGRHAVPLAAMGLDVTGVDLSRFLLQRAKAYAKNMGVDVDWRHEDMRHHQRQGHYDLILNLFSSFGYFDDWNDNQMVLDQACTNLADNGVLILDVRGKEQILRDLAPVHAQEFEEDPLLGYVLYQRPTLIYDLSRLHNEWTLVAPDDSIYRHTYSHDIYTAQELKMMLRHAGFTEVDAYGDLNGSPYDLDAERLILVARR